MTDFTDFLSLISEAKKESIAKETVLTEKIKNNSFFDFLGTPTIEIKSKVESIQPTIEPIVLEKIQEVELIETVEPIIEPIVEIVEPEFSKEQFIEELIQQPIVEKKSIDLLDPNNYNKLFKNNTNHFEQPKLPKIDPTFKTISDKLQYLENWMSKISMTGPGSGEVNFRYLDDVNRNSIGNTDQILRYNPIDRKFFFGQLSGNQGPINSLEFANTGITTTPKIRTLDWNETKDCLNVYQTDGTTLQVGLEQYIRVINNTANTITVGDFVKFAGVNGPGNETPMIIPFIANSTAIPLISVGVLSETLAPGQIGRATILGEVHDVNTTGAAVGETWQVGDLLYAHPTIPGKLTKEQPTAPDVVVSVAAVLVVDAIDGLLLVRPTIFPRLYYGSFYDTTVQTAAVINTAYAIRIANTEIASGFYTANSSQIISEYHGLYNFQFSLQMISTNASQSNFWVWPRKNGQDIPRSATKVTIAGNGSAMVPAWNFLISMEPGDYFQLMWATDSTAVSIDAPAATAFCPSTPSVLLSVSQTNL